MRTLGFMAKRRTTVLAVTLVLTAWALSAVALDRSGAIEAAKRQVKNKCTSATPCKFDARAEKDKWHVRVEFTKRNSPQDEALPYPGGQAIFIFDQTGKVVGRIEGK
jgi:hypothetical protein